MLIYKITNKINGKSYIGQTTQTLEKRWYQHCRGSGCTYLNKALQKYGPENFQLEIVYQCQSLQELNRKEEDFIKSFDSLAPKGYNIQTGGQNYLHAEETKEKMSKAKQGHKHFNYGKKQALKTKEKIRDSRTGFRQSPEVKRKMSESKKGPKNPFYDKKHTEESKTTNKLNQKTRKSAIGYNLKTGKSWYFISLKESEKFGFDSGAISKCCRDLVKSHKGFIWEYINVRPT